ncbi:MAG: hypothetical protein LBF90_03260 [Prevotellaceae bacterium]|jgi:hypothetical protein|nr:hypothetical protein [Prevotellaceae bacterium]
MGPLTKELKSVWAEYTELLDKISDIKIYLYDMDVPDASAETRAFLDHFYAEYNPIKEWYDGAYSTISEWHLNKYNDDVKEEWLVNSTTNRDAKHFLTRLKKLYGETNAFLSNGSTASSSAVPGVAGVPAATGSNTSLYVGLLLLAVAGVGVWWFMRRKKGRRIKQ